MNRLGHKRRFNRSRVVGTGGGVPQQHVGHKKTGHRRPGAAALLAFFGFRSV